MWIAFGIFSTYFPKFLPNFHRDLDHRFKNVTRMLNLSLLVAFINMCVIVYNIDAKNGLPVFNQFISWVLFSKYDKLFINLS